MNWEDILTEQQALTFVKDFGDVSCGSWRLHAPTGCPEMNSIKIHVSSWNGFMTDICSRLYTYSHINRSMKWPNGSLYTGQIVYLKFCEQPELLIKRLRNISTRIHNINRLSRIWRTNPLFGLWIKFECSEDGNILY